MTKPDKSELFGFLNINKPKGITSFDVIYKLRKILGIKKIGHGGTLDPLASGVLPIGVGDATRLLEYLEGDKKYIGKIKFGEISKTYDEEGEKEKIKEPNFTLSEFQAALVYFKGKIEQKPPMYSAIKIKGQKLYNLARKGIELDVPKRRVEIYDIKILSFNLPFAEIEVSCSEGAYIRSLANDIGEKLGCGAYLADLKRVSASGFNIEDSCNLDNLGEIIEPQNVLKMPKYELNDEEFKKIINGNPIKINSDFNNEKIMLVYKKKLVSISKISDRIIKVEKVFKRNFE